MKAIWLPIVVLLMVSCTAIEPSRPPGQPQVTAAERQPSALAPARDTRALSNEANRHAAVARARLASAQEDLGEYRAQVLSLRQMVESLQEKGSADSSNLAELFEKVAKQDAYILKMVESLNEVQTDLTAEQELRKKADESLAKATELIAAKEVEADQLRQQFEDQKLTSAAFEENAQKNYEVALSAKSEADVIRGQKKTITKILLGVCGLALLSLTVNWLQFKGKAILPF